MQCQANTMGMLMSVSLDGTFAQPGFESRRCWQCRADPCKRAATNWKRALLFQTFKNPRRGLTVTLNCDTEMLLGCTLRRTHCLMSEAKRRGSDERSHFSFRVHLQREKNPAKKHCYSLWWSVNGPPPVDLGVCLKNNGGSICGNGAGPLGRF